ncbi:MAG TPA: LysR family transcriptional regulator [Marmoricola sp.]|jgi:DNA-binding transcriptional LysR family regulator|nr:LysR family transcriptional regulator [Marmoricola sp.]
MELRHLAGFVAVAEELHFGRAAAKLHMSQSPLSQQIRLLERDLGVTLFERSTRSVRLTAAGQSLIGPAQQVLAAAAVARRAARAAGKGEVGRVSLGFAGTSSAVTMPVLTRAVAEELPGVELALQGPLFSGETLGRIADGTLDLGFAAGRLGSDGQPLGFQESGLESRLVREDPLVLAISDVHRLAGAAAVALEDLAAEDFVAFPGARGSIVRALSVSSCEEAGFSPAIVQEAPDTFSLLSLVAAGVGVALVVEPTRTVALERVAFVPLSGVAPILPLSLAWRTSNRSPALRAVLEVAGRVFTMS